jgi:hypothetical protein
MGRERGAGNTLGDYSFLFFISTLPTQIIVVESWDTKSKTFFADRSFLILRINRNSLQVRFGIVHNLVSFL